MSAWAKTPIMPMNVIGTYTSSNCKYRLIGAHMYMPNKTAGGIRPSGHMAHMMWQPALIVAALIVAHVIIGAANKVIIQTAHRDMYRRATHRDTLTIDIAFKAFTIDSASFDLHSASFDLHTAS